MDHARRLALGVRLGTAQWALTGEMDAGVRDTRVESAWVC